MLLAYPAEPYLKRSFTLFDRQIVEFGFLGVHRRCVCMCNEAVPGTVLKKHTKNPRQAKDQTSRVNRQSSLHYSR